MKIVMLISHFPPEWIAGTEIAGYNIAKQLAKREHEVHVITRCYLKQPRFEKKDGFCVHRVRYLNLPIIRAITHIIFTLIEVSRLKPDIICGYMIFPNGLSAVIAKKLLKKPSITHVQGCDIYRVSKLRKRTISQFVLRKSNVVIALTENMKDRIYEVAGEENVMVLPNGIDLKRSINLKKGDCRKELGIPLNDNIVLFVGRLIRLKGVEYLINAFNEVIKNISKVNLFIIGKGEQEQNLKEMIERLHIGRYVRVIGEVTNTEVQKYMVSSDVFVLPSLSESFGIVLLEAMAAALPIVATKVGGIPEVVKDGENGFLVKPENSDELSNEIIFLLKDKNLRNKISENNLEKVKKYDWQNIVAELEKIYQSQLSKEINECQV